MDGDDSRLCSEQRRTLTPVQRRLTRPPFSNICPGSSVVEREFEELRVSSSILFWGTNFMVGVAQLIERQIVGLDVAGLNPVSHPNIYPSRWYCGPESSKLGGKVRFLLGVPIYGWSTNVAHLMHQCGG